VIGELLLFGDGAGNYVNRYQDDGQQFAAVDSSNERFGGSTEDECQAFCAVDVAANCESTCAILEADAEAKQTNYEAGLAAEPALSGDELAQLQQAATDAAAEADGCTADCTAGQETAAAACVPTCKPCSYSTLTSSPSWCMYGELLYFDGDPLFFPVDGVTGATADFARARLSADYGYAGYPDEDNVIADAPLHNFYFTTEVQTRFQYTANMNASIEVAGDDDVWVFVNGNLAIDLGGLHQPQTASATISSATAPALGLEEGGTYPISIFHAERALYGSTLLLKFNGLLPLGQAGSSGCQVN
jgi:fibro-slime domain-containing protein